MSKTDDGLLPCPHCGGEPRKCKDDNGNWAQIFCNSCGARGPENPDEAKARAGWNRRPQSSRSSQALLVQCQPSPCPFPDIHPHMLASLGERQAQHLSIGNTLQIIKDELKRQRAGDDLRYLVMDDSVNLIEVDGYIDLVALSSAIDAGCQASMPDFVIRIRNIIAEWRKGCSCGPAGECDECTQAAMEAVWKVVTTPSEEEHTGVAP